MLQTDNEAFRRFCFVMVLSQRREKNPSAHRRCCPAISLDLTEYPLVLFSSSVNEAFGPEDFQGSLPWLLRW